MSTIPYEVVNIKCPECGKEIETHWATNGNRGLLPGDYVLIADWVFHPACWDAMVERNPP